MDLAKSQLVSARSSKDIFAIEFVDKEMIQFKADTKVLFIFLKYKMSKDDDWQMGISGMQLRRAKLEKTPIVNDTDFVKFTNKKLKADDEPTIIQFDKQLKRLIFSKHKSAVSFYLDNDYYMNRNNEDD